MPATYEPIATTTLSGTSSLVTFSNVSTAYTDLRLIVVARAGANDNDTVRVRFNNDSGNNYSNTRMYGSGSVLNPERSTSQDHFFAGYLGPASLSNRFSICIIDIFAYRNSLWKSMLSTNANDQNQAGSGYSNTVYSIAGLWRLTDAITNIQISPSANAFQANSSFTLFGIKAA